MINTLDKIEQKILNNERLTKEDGLALFASNDLARIGYLADLVRKRISGDLLQCKLSFKFN